MEQRSHAAHEKTVLRRLSAEVTVATFSLLWAENFGQKIDGIRGFVTHVLPSKSTCHSGPTSPLRPKPT